MARILAALATVAALVMSACGGDDQDPSADLPPVPETCMEGKKDARVSAQRIIDGDTARLLYQGNLSNDPCEVRVETDGTEVELVPVVVDLEIEPANRQGWCVDVRLPPGTSEKVVDRSDPMGGIFSEPGSQAQLRTGKGCIEVRAVEAGAS